MDTSKRNTEIYFLIALLFVLVTLFVVGTKYPPRPRELPLLVDTIGIVIVLIHLIGVLRLKTGEKAEKGSNKKGVIICFGSMVLYLLSTFFIGMVLSSAIIVYGCGMGFGARDKRKLAAASLIVVVLVYLIIVKLLNVQLYEGLIFH